MTEVPAVEAAQSEESDPSIERLAINPYVRVIRASDDEVVVRHGTRSLYSEFISDAGRRHLLGRILDRLGSPASLRALLDEGFVDPDDVAPLEEAIAYLRQRRVLVPAEQDWRPTYFDTFYGRRDGLRGQVVAVLGAGLLARRICASLAPLGLEAIIALDRAGDDYPTEVETRDADSIDATAISRLFGDCDFAICALDAYSPRSLHLTNQVAVAMNKPWLACFFDGHESVIGPLFVPGQTGCYAEFELQAEASLTQINEGLLMKEELDARPAPGGRLLPPYVDIAGGFAIDAAMRFLLAGSSYVVGRAMRLDFERASIDYQEVLTLPRCPACQGTRTAYRHVFL